MSFGISAFVTNTTELLIETYSTNNILKEGTGSGTVGIKLNTGEIVQINKL